MNTFCSPFTLGVPPLSSSSKGLWFMGTSPWIPSLVLLACEWVVTLGKIDSSIYNGAGTIFNINCDIDKTAPSKKFMQLTSDQNQRLLTLIVQLHTGHIGLNQNLFIIRRSETPSCPHCRGIEAETVQHYLQTCPQYNNKRQKLQGKLERKYDNLPYLLIDPKATPHLIDYINSTKCFKTAIGHIPHPVYRKPKKNMWNFKHPTTQHHSLIGKPIPSLTQTTTCRFPKTLKITSVVPSATHPHLKQPSTTPTSLKLDWTTLGPTYKPHPIFWVLLKQIITTEFKNKARSMRMRKISFGPVELLLRNEQVEGTYSL